MLKLAVFPIESNDFERASILADKLNLPLLAADSEPALHLEYDALLTVGGAAVGFQKMGKLAPGSVSVDFGNPEMRHRRRGGANELLGRAVGVGKKTPLRIIDATAGLGRDAFVLADLGCSVSLWERNPVIEELLAAGFHLAHQSEDPWLRETVSRMQLSRGDVRDSGVLPNTCDVIYLDPMFPVRQKQAAVKKEMALFQWLLQDTEPAAEVGNLLSWSLQQPVARVVLKRPAKSDPLAQGKPSHTINGKAVRYDVYVLSGFTQSER